MTEKQVFGIVVRSFGLLAVIYGLTQGLIVVASRFGSVPHRYPLREDAIFSLFWVVLGTLLMRLGDWVVRFAYG